MVVEGLIPPGGVHGTLKNSGISRDRKKNGDLFFRIQPHETLYLSNYSPRADIVVFQPDQRVLDVFENCGVATSWTLDIPMETYTYDSGDPGEQNTLGKLTKVSGGFGEVKYSYSKCGCLKVKTRTYPGLAQPMKVAYETDNLKRYTKIKYPDGFEASILYSRGEIGRAHV